MAQLPQVAYVQRPELRPLQTDRGPSSSAPRRSGPAARAEPFLQGRIVVGIVDTGPTPIIRRSPRSAASSYHHVNPLGAGNYLGDCATGHATATTS
jgi:hypothetical protein